MYKYLNLNPLNIEEEDCVVRAITLAVQEDYDEVKYKLYRIANLLNCDALCVCCYEYLLTGYYGFKRTDEFKGLTINEFKHLNFIGTFVIRVDGHLTCIIDGTLYDIWDCGNEIIDTIWIPNKF